MTKLVNQFQVPCLEDLTQFFKESFGRDLSMQEQKMMNFFANQVEKAVRKNMGSDRLKLCSTMILMLSPQARRDYSLSREFFAKDKKRIDLAETIQAILLEDITTLNDIIHRSNDKLTDKIRDSFAADASDKFFEEIDECDVEEKSVMREFCVGYVVSLTKEIYNTFNKEEADLWRSSKLPIPHMLLNHPEDRLQILGHTGGVVEEVNSTPSRAISNPCGYSLRSRLKRSLEEDSSAKENYRVGRL